MRKILLGIFAVAGIASASNFNLGINGGAASTEAGMTGDIAINGGYFFQKDILGEINYLHAFQVNNVTLNVVAVDVKKLFPLSPTTTAFVKAGSAYINTSYDNGYCNNNNCYGNTNSSSSLSVLAGAGLSFKIAPQIAINIEQDIYFVTTQLNTLNAGVSIDF